LQLLSESGYHPDLFLSTKLYKETPVEQVKDTYSLVRGSETNTIGGCCEKGVFSQALVTLPWWYFQNAAVGDRFVDRNNRMLYFYEDMTIDGVQYPSYYPYIEHIIRGTVLKIPTENVLADRTEFNIGNAVVYRTQPYLIYDISESGDLVLMSADGGDSLVLNSSKVTKMDSLLDEYKINYLKYNNLYYYYLNLYEKLGQPTIFIVQFLCSKVSRGFLDWGRGLISGTRSQRLNECQGIIVRLINCMSYVSSLDFVMEDDANDRISNITTNLQVKGLVNKVFTVNYMLNLT